MSGGTDGVKMRRPIFTAYLDLQCIEDGFSSYYLIYIYDMTTYLLLSSFHPFLPHHTVS